MRFAAGGLAAGLALFLSLTAVAGGGSPPTVYRGNDDAMDAPAPAAKEPPAAPDEQIVGGDRFWRVDPQTGRMVACRLVQTANVGEQRIECAAGTLAPE